MMSLRRLTWPPRPESLAGVHTCYPCLCLLQRPESIGERSAPALQLVTCSPGPAAGLVSSRSARLLDHGCR